MSENPIGTRKFWKPDPIQSKLTKNGGYITIGLQSAFYRSNGNWWQKTFGGKDKITLSTKIGYKDQDQSITRTTIQKVTEVKAARSTYLGVANLLALKIPAISDGIEISASITSVSDDNFQRTLDILSSDEFKKPLEIVPINVGEALAISNIIKKVFTDDSKKTKLDAEFYGVIPSDEMVELSKEEYLKAGHLIVISSDDDDSNILETLVLEDLSIDADQVRYKNKPLNITHFVYKFSFDSSRGVDVKSSWYRKFITAINKLDDIIGIDNKDKIKQIKLDAIGIWKEGKVLLEEDESYIPNEKKAISLSYYQRIIERAKELSDDKLFLDTEIVNLTHFSEYFGNSKGINIEEQIVLASNHYMKSLVESELLFPLE